MTSVPRLYEPTSEHGVSGAELLHYKLAQNIAAWMPYALGPFSRPKEKHRIHTAPPSLSPPPLRGLGTFCTQTPLEDSQEATVLADHFSLKIGYHPTLHPPIPINTVITSLAPAELSQPFTHQEIEEATASVKGKAAGHDKILYEFLIHLTPSFQETLFNLYNTSWLIDTYPICWKHSTIILIPNQARTQPSLQLTVPLHSFLVSGSWWNAWCVTVSLGGLKRRISLAWSSVASVHARVP